MVPCESNFECNVYIIGGMKNEDEFLRDIMKFTLSDEILKQTFWLLHFLKATRFNRMISINMHEDLVSMYQGKE